MTKYIGFYKTTQYASLLKDLFYIVGKDTSKLYILSLMYIINPLIDVLGIGLLGPYMQLLTDNDGIQNSFFSRFGESIGFEFLDSQSIIIFSSLTILIVFSLKFITSIFVNYLLVKFMNYYLVLVRKELIYSFKNVPYEEYIFSNSSKYVDTTVGMSSTFISHNLGAFTNLFAQLVLTFMLLVLLFLTNWQLLFLMLIIIIPLGITYDRLFRKKIINYGIQKSIGRQKIIGAVKDFFQGFKQNKILNSFDYFEKKVIQGALDIQAGEIKSKVLNFLPRHFIELIFIFIFIIFIIILSFYSSNFLTYFSTFVIFAIASIRMIPGVVQIMHSFQMIAESKYSTSIILEQIKNIRKNKKNSKDNSTIISNDEFSSLELKNIKYKYPKTENYVLNNINIKITKNETIGLIGPSGSGKTTLVDLILGLLNFNSGKLLINNKDIKDYGLKNWQLNVAYLPQDLFLVDDTILKNITLSPQDNSNDQEIIYKVNNSIKKANLSKFVGNLPDGINTIVGEKGMRISGGQKQRLIFARAFFHNRTIFILDESTSSLDSETENQLMHEINKIKGKVTLIIIAHRMTTVKLCDKIYRLSEGKIINSGTYEEVIKDHD